MLETLESLPPELVVAAVAILVVGMAAAFALGRRTADGSHRVQELEGALEDARRSRAEVETQLGEYRARVTDHFTETSEKLHDLTLHYRAVYEHLAKGAAELCPEGFEQLAGGLGLDALPNPEGKGERTSPASERTDAASRSAASDDEAPDLEAPPESDISPEDLAEEPREPRS